MTMSSHALPSGTSTPAGPALLVAVATVTTAAAMLSAGADIIDLGDPGAAEVAEFVASHPGVAFCAQDRRATLTRREGLAKRGGAALVCDDLTAARASSLPAARLIVRTRLDGIAEVTRAGFAALVDADLAGGPDPDSPDPDSPDPDSPDPGDRGGRDQGAAGSGRVAAAALACWLGAALVRTRHPLAVRRAIDMTASVQGLRPPARTVRGLA